MELGSLAYGPLDHAVYDSQIAPYVTDERDLAKLHMTRLLELGLGGSLLLFDRWYPSREFIAYTLHSGFSFAMRVRKKWNLAVDAIDLGKILKHPRKANLNRTIAKLRRDFWMILLEDNPIPPDAMSQKLCADIALRPESVCPGRSPVRKSPRNKRFPIAKKSVLP